MFTKVLLSDDLGSINQGVMTVLDTLKVKELEKKFDAVKLVRVGSDIIGGKGGGGRIDFAQAGGTLPNKIDDSFESIKKLIS